MQGTAFYITSHDLIFSKLSLWSTLCCKWNIFISPLIDCIVCMSKLGSYHVISISNMVVMGNGNAYRYSISTFCLTSLFVFVAR